MKKKITILVAMLLIAFGAYQTTMALFHEETNIQSPISAGSLGIEITTSTNDSSDKIQINEVMPGSVINNPVTLKNVKDKDLYVRVTLTRYWIDKDGNKIVDANAGYIQPMTNTSTPWIIIDDKENSNNEIMYFYYKAPMKSGDVTTPMIDAIQFDPEINDPIYGTYKAFVSVEAEAIQKIGAEDAILSQWGMEASFDTNGTLLDIKE